MNIDWSVFIPFDWKVFEFIENNIWADWLTPIMKIITYLGEAGIIWIIPALVLMFFKKTRKVGFAVIVSIIIMAILNNVVLKSLFERPRPFNLPEMLDLGYIYPDMVGRPDSFSFPSGHTSSAFACAFAFTAASRNKWVGIGTFLLAAVMGFTRLYLHVHYFSDIAGGIIVGIIYGIIGVLLANWIFPILEKKVFAKLGKKK